MAAKKRILLKLTGELFLNQKNKKLSADAVNDIIRQIKELHNTHQFGIVVGGGNFFRGKEHGKLLGISQSMGHQVGMLATMMNGLILKDLLEQQGIATEHVCAISSPEIGKPISQQAITTALNNDRTLIFSGGTGNPFFTTDTTSILRALQARADEVWKGTHVAGVYDKDPNKYPDAQLIKKLTFSQALQEKLGIMDATAYALAQQHQQSVRVFDIFTENALVRAAHEQNFGSIIQEKE